ncbi:MAG: acyltransferase [Devosia sp.]
MSNTSSEPRNQFVALAGLRGVAALIVLQYHGAIFMGGVSLPAGYLAVDFFFLLSGWVLAHAYDARLAGPMSAAQFLRARLVRLYPAYLLVLLLNYCGAVIMGGSPLGALLAGLVFLPNFWVPDFDWLVRVAWSLTAELLANLPFAAFHRLLTARVLVACVAVALGALILSGWAYRTLDLGHSSRTWIGLPTRVFFSFPLGVLLYRYRARLAQWAPRWGAWPAMGLLILVLAIPAPLELRGARDLAIVVLALPAILLFGSNAEPGPLTSRIATVLGDMSYPLYLLHVTVFSAVNILLLAVWHRDLDSASLPFALALLAGIMLVSWLIDRFYDRPVRQLLSAGWSRVTPATGRAMP